MKNFFRLMFTKADTEKNALTQSVIITKNNEEPLIEGIIMFKTRDNNKSQRSSEGIFCSQKDSICASCKKLFF